MPWRNGWYVPMTQKPPIKRKKQRKYDLQVEVYCRKMRKWWLREPPKWRLIAHFRWKCEEPGLPRRLR